jgi:hypothetical protein
MLAVSMFVMIMVPINEVYSNTSDMEWQSTIFPRTAYPPIAESFGDSVEVGDVNGDNLDDIIVYSSRYIRVYEGSHLTEYNQPPMLEIDLHWSQYSTDIGTLALADVNDDGIQDIIFGEYQTSNDYGSVSVYYGNSEWTTGSYSIQLDAYDDRDWYVSGPGRFGFSVSNAGDAGGDGIDDIMVGAPIDGGGKAFVYYGSATGLPENLLPSETYVSYLHDYTYPPPARDLHEFSVERLGYQVARGSRRYIGDKVYDNQIMGCPTTDIDLNDGGTYYDNEIEIGTAITTPSTQIFLPGEGDGPISDYKWFGYSLGNVGDVNGDGYPEVIVCAVGRYSWVPHKSFLYLGDDYYSYPFRWGYDWSVEGIPYRGVAPFWIDRYLFTPVGSAGDINGDGYGDIFIGDETYNPDDILGGDGRIYIWFGGPPSAEDPSGLGQNQTPETADIILDPSDVGHMFAPMSFVSFGHSVASGDINGDGVDDIVVGDPTAYHEDGGGDPGVRSGAVHVFFSTFELSREALWNRLVEIILAWPTATPEEREELWEEIVEIILLWPTAP